jgi:hypothetical protein
LTGLVNVFSADMTCVPGSTLNSSVTATEDFWHVSVDVTDGRCATGLVTLTDVQRNYSEYETTQTQSLTVGRAILQQCPDIDEPTLFLIIAQTKATAMEVFGNETVETITDWTIANFSMDTTVIVCTPSYKLQEALVTTTAQGALLGEAKIQSESRNLSISRWDLWSAVNRSLVAAGPAFLNGPMANDMQIGGFLYDQFLSVLISTWTRAPNEYLDPDTLTHDTQRLFKAVAGQISSRYMRKDSQIHTTGSYRATQSRILLLDTSLRILEAEVTVIVICACLMVLYSSWVPHSEAGDDTAVLAVVLARSAQLKRLLTGSGILSHERLIQSLTNQSFACIDDNSAETDLVQVYDSSTGHIPDIDTSDCDFWRPSALSRIRKFLTIVMPLAVIASLEVTYQVSHSNPEYGLASVPSNHRWHYAWTWIPALVMTVTKFFCRSVTTSITLLDPYSRLRKQGAVGYSTFRRSNLSKPSLQLCFEGLQNRRWAVLATSLSALLGPFLTIIVSGLFWIDTGSLGLDATFYMADHVVSPSGRYCSSSSWTQASLCAASLLQSDGHAVFPRGTTHNIVYPLQQSDWSYTAMEGAPVFNASTIQIDVPVVVPQVACKVLDPAGFRYTLGTDSTNSSALGGSGISAYNGTYLNLTHTDLAGYQCQDSWFSCDEFSCPHNGIRCLNLIPSLGYEFDNKNLTSFLDLLYASDLEHTPLRWADPEGWPDSQALVQAVATRNDFPSQIPDLFAIYGSWSPEQVNLNGIRCYFDVFAGRANVSYFVNTTEAIDVQLLNGTFTYLSNTSNCTPWNGPRGDQLEAFLPDNSSLWTTALDGSDAISFDSQDGAATLAQRISVIYNNYYTQYYNVALRDHNTTDETNQATGYVWDDNWERLVQSKVSTRILQCILAVMWLCTTIVLVLFDVNDLLPKNPCSIAAQASLLADSEFLDMIPTGAENATAEELMKMTPFVDHQFSMGWWDDENGGRRFGIDIGKADFNKDGDGESKEEEGVDVEMMTIAPNDGYSAVGQANERASIEVAAV